jgi:hypothetical protein
VIFFHKTTRNLTHIFSVIYTRGLLSVGRYQQWQESSVMRVGTARAGQVTLPWPSPLSALDLGMLVLSLPSP